MTAGISRSEPLSQLVPDAGLGVLALVLAGALLVHGARDPAHGVLGAALAASAAAFSLQSAAADEVLATVTGFDQVDVVPQLVLPVITCVTFVLALAWAPRSGPPGRPGRWVVAAVVAVAGAAVLGMFLPASVRCVLLAGLVLPLVGVAGLRRRLRTSTSERLRAPARLLFGLLVATVAVGAALAVITGLLVWVRTPGLGLVDPTALNPLTLTPSRPSIVLWYWAARLTLPIVALAVLMTGRRAGAASAQRWFSRGLVVVLVTAAIGCLFVFIDLRWARFVLGWSQASPALTRAVAVGLCALAFLPVFVLTERAVDRLLYGSRPAPYGVLADVAALPRGATGGVPDLAGVAEAVGRGLGATTCRLTVHRPGLRDRSYQWVRPGEEEAETSLEVPVRHAEQEVGTIAVDRAAVAGADDQRQDLLRAVANSLGVVLQAVRTNIDLERQLRTSVARAAEIADARRRVVAEADRERRRIERDLHDGAQHHLVSLSLALGLAEHEVAAGRAEQARARMDQILGQLDTAEAVLTRTATGLSSAALAQRGVVAALRDELGQDPHVRLDTPGVDGARFSPDVEAAVYFCCLESVNNARKYAGGAAVRVRLERAGDHLLFSVEDDGRGWDPATSGSLGRGVRNMTSRVSGVGGHLDVRSAPGEGTRVEGWVPLGDPGAPPPTPGGVPAPRPLEQVRIMVRRARDLYHGTAHAQSLSTLTRQLGEPPRIGLAGPSPALVDAVRRRLDGALHAPGRRAPTSQETPVLVPMTCLDRTAPDGADPSPDLGITAGADAVVLLVPSTARGADCYRDLLALAAALQPSQVLGVLVADGDAGAEAGGEGAVGDGAAADDAGRVAAPEELRRLCATVLPVGGAVRSEEQERQAYVDLADLVRTRLEARLEAFRARAAVAALTTLLHRAPPPGDAHPLLYELDRFRLGRPELTELDLLDQLTAADAPLPPAERLAAVRLLGLLGTDPAARLGCGPDAEPGQLVRAAREHLAHWQQVAAHPASSTGTRTVARFLVGTCERLLTTTGG
ncbi:ATP-binding protein [Geodermatophilus sp. SYSU D00708]